MSSNNVMAKIFLFDGVKSYDKMTLKQNDIKFISLEEVADIEKLKAIAARERKNVALVSDDLKFFVHRS